MHGHEHSRSLLDRFGVGVSLGCAVHCVLSALAALVPAFGVGALGETMEWLELPFLLTAFGVGLFALVPAYVREHRRATPIKLFVLGIGIVSMSRVLSGAAEAIVTVSGVALIATAHVLNLRLCAAHHAAQPAALAA